MLPEPYDFDAQKTYRVPVVLFAFSDLDFSMDNPAAYYDRLFNEKGFNEGMGPGCVADYFRDQSAGRLRSLGDRYLGVTTAVTQVPVPTATSPRLLCPAIGGTK